MSGLTEWRQTRFYQEVREETQLEIVPRMLNEGLSIKQIAKILELDIKIVRQVANKHNQESQT